MVSANGNKPTSSPASKIHPRLPLCMGLLLTISKKKPTTEQNSHSSSFLPNCSQLHDFERQYPLLIPTCRQTSWNLASFVTLTSPCLQFLI